MKKVRFGILVSLLSICAFSFGIEIKNTIGNDFLKKQATAGETTYKLTIGNDGSNPEEKYRLTTEEKAACEFTRKTDLDNDVKFGLDGSGHFNLDTNNILLMYSHGYFYNKTPLTGLKTIKIRFNTSPVKIYYGPSADSLPYYTDELAVGTYTIDVTKAGDVSYFKVLATNGSVYVKFLECTYSCSTSANRGVVRTGTGAGGLYNPIDLKKTYNVADGGTINVDFKFIDPTITTNGFSIYLVQDNSNYFGNYKVQYDATYGYILGYKDATYSGVSLAPLNDGYFRITFDLATLSKNTGTPAQLSQVKFSWFLSSEGVYFDVEPELNVQYKIAGHYIIGLPVYSGAATLSFDLQITSGNKFWAKLMSDTFGTYSGNYRFDANANVTTTTDYVTATKISWNGFVHVEFDLSKFSGRIVRFEDVSDWTDPATGYIENLKVA